MAAKLTGLSGATLIQTHEPALPAALDRLADDVIVFGQACLDAGTDGFFFATQFAASATLPPGEYERWGVPFDVRVLNALRPRSWGLILHLHGDEPQFDLSDRHPADAVNWHARETTPSLSQGLAATRRGLVGGIARMGSIVSGPAGALIAEARDAIAQTQGRRLVVAPGCVVPTTAPDDHLTALRRAVG
jgi:uroporphyrinogen decarboxylase